MTVFYLGNPRFRAFTAGGLPLAGGKLYTYVESTATPKASYSEPTGVTAHANPIILDADGGAEIWLDGRYKLQLDNSADVLQWTMDKVFGVGFVDAAAAATEWVPQTADTPVFIDTTNFSVTGDKRTTYQVGRRVRATVTAGTLYGTISVSAFVTVTTVTVVWDSGVLDAGLSAVAVGFISATNPSINWQAVDDVEHSTVVAGTRMLFQQSTPPTGWTKETNALYDDAALHLVTGAVGTGGTDVFTAVFGPSKDTLGHALTVNELAIHSHTLGATSMDAAGAHTHTLPATNVLATGTAETGPSAADAATHGGTTGSDGDHTHTFTGGTDNTGSNAPHIHGLTMALKYAECCIGVKD